MINYHKASTSLKIASIVGVAAILAAAASQAGADTIAWTFASANPLGTSHTYSATSHSGATIAITATGYNSSGGTTANLYYNDWSTVETGLGITPGAPTNEIANGQFVQLDLANLINALQPGVNNITLTMGSVQGGDAFAAYYSSVAGALGSNASVASGGSSTFPLGGLPQVTFGVAANDGPYLDITETSPGGSVLLNNMDVSTSSNLPEPASLAMFGMAGLGLLLLPRKRVA